MSNIYHWTCFGYQITFLGASLCLEQLIRILGLTEYIHYPSVEGVGVVASLVIERMPQAAAHVLACGEVKRFITCIRIRWLGIALGLNQHWNFTPNTIDAAGRVVRVPIIYVIAPFAGEVGDFGVEHIYAPSFAASLRMGKEYRIVFASFRGSVACSVAIGVGILLVDDVLYCFGKICRIPSFVQYRFPQPYRWVVAVATHHVANV